MKHVDLITFKISAHALNISKEIDSITNKSILFYISDLTYWIIVNRFSVNRSDFLRRYI